MILIILKIQIIAILILRATRNVNGVILDMIMIALLTVKKARWRNSRGSALR